MVVKNKKNGTNVLAYKDNGSVVRVTIRSGEQVNIPHLTDINQVVNKLDFDGSRGWFEIVANDKVVVEKETNLEKAKKEVIEYSEENTKKKKK